jgi:hypothetical protein
MHHQRLGGTLLLKAAVADAGAIQVPSYYGAEEVAAGRLVQLLPEGSAGEMELFLVYPGPQALRRGIEVSPIGSRRRGRLVQGRQVLLSHAAVLRDDLHRQHLSHLLACPFEIPCFLAADHPMERL